MQLWNSVEMAVRPPFPPDRIYMDDYVQLWLLKYIGLIWLSSFWPGRWFSRFRQILLLFIIQFWSNVQRLFSYWDGKWVQKLSSHLDRAFLEVSSAALLKRFLFSFLMHISQQRSLLLELSIKKGYFPSCSKNWLAFHSKKSSFCTVCSGRWLFLITAT